MSLKERIAEGISGKYEGLANGFKDLNKFIFGVQRKCYTLIGGASGTFKTTLLDYIILNAMLDADKKNIPIDVFYYSFEIDKISKMCNWTAQMVYMKYGVVIKPESIKGLGDNRLTIDEQAMVDDVTPEVEELFSRIKFTFHPLNPTGIYNEIFKYCETQGELLYEPYTDELGQEKQKIVGYKPKDSRYIIVAVDHIYLAKKERGFTTKENIDKLSEYLVALRNIFSISPIILQQYNQGLSATDRLKFKGADISPQQTDFKDSTNPYQDSDVALGIMNPYKMDMDTCLGYNLDILEDRFIMIKIIKNRLSRDNIAKGVVVHPESGRFVELPSPKEMKTPADYKKYL
jgi:replicative DNA helicase